MVHMSTIETLNDDEIDDEYDIDEMERLDILSTDDDFVLEEPKYSHCYWMDNPAFHDTSAWDENPANFDYRAHVSRNESDVLYKGQIWETKQDAKYAVQLYSIARRVEFKTERSDLDTLRFICKTTGQNCPWKVRIKKKPNTSYWTLTQYGGEHVCNRTIILRDNIHLNKKVIAKHFESVLREKLRLDPMKIQADVAKDFGYQIKYLKAWQAKQVAMTNAFGSWDESFARLPQVMDVLMDSNPGTIVRWNREHVGEGVVQINRVFWAFGPAIKAFAHCRPVLSVDGTHLYGKYNGRLLVAIALDGDNHLMPLAFALVESENNASWKWFMRCLRDGPVTRDGVCIISDRHKGILAAMTLEEWSPPRACHRFCLRHLKSNFNQKLKNDPALKNELGRIGYIADPKIFDACYNTLLRCMEHHPTTRNWLQSIPVEKWSLAYDDGQRWGAMTTNAAECFNKILKGCRDLPISALVRFTFMQTNEYAVARRCDHTGYPSPFTPTIDAEIQKLIEEGKFLRCILYDRDDMIVRVEDGGIENYHEVNMYAKACTCGKFAAYHYPCKHALAVCREFRVDIQEYVPEEYTLNAFWLTWSYVFNIPPRESTWEEYTGPMHIPNPDYKRAGVGRQPTRRIRNEMDWPDTQPSQTQDVVGSGEGSSRSRPKKTQHCKQCGGVGHNARSCSSRNRG